MKGNLITTRAIKIPHVWPATAKPSLLSSGAADCCLPHISGCVPLLISTFFYFYYAFSSDRTSIYYLQLTITSAGYRNSPDSFSFSPSLMCVSSRMRLFGRLILCVLCHMQRAVQHASLNMTLKEIKLQFVFLWGSASWIWQQRHSKQVLLMHGWATNVHNNP